MNAERSAAHALGPLLDRDNPWPGPAAYEESSQHFFSGRASEVDELLRRILDEPVTVLFGKSGLGKSSLLRAGVFPRLRERDHLPILLRLQLQAGAPALIEQVRIALFGALREARIEHPPCGADESLWENLHRADLEFWTLKNRLVRPVLVFDQFEELYTLGRDMRAEVGAFREALADLAENRIPAALAPRFDSTEVDDDAAAAQIDRHAMPYKVVVSLREDFLPDLEGWLTTMPSLRRNRMRLLPMGPMQAICNSRTSHLVDVDLAKRIVEFLAGGTIDARAFDAPDDTAPVIEPSLLSLFCQGVNDSRKAQGKQRFDDELIKVGKETIVADFYRKCVGDQPLGVRRFIEDELVTDQGFRNSFAALAAVTRGLVTREQIETLVLRRLLRLEHHLGAERIELTHDLLTRVVLEGRTARVAVERAAEQRRRAWKTAGIAAAVLAVAGAFMWQQFVRLQSDERSAQERAAAAAKSASAADERARHDRDAKKELEQALQQAARASQELEQAYQKVANASRTANDAKVRAEEAGNLAKKQRLLAETSRKFAEKARTEAEAARNLARSRELAAHAIGQLEKNRERAVLLALEALRSADTPEARSVLTEAARYAWPGAVLEARVLGSETSVIAMDSAGTRLAVLAVDGQMSAWDLGTRMPRRIWHRKLDVTDGKGISFDPTGRDLLVARPGFVDRLDAASGDTRDTLALPPDLDQSESAVQLALSADGHWLAAATSSGRLLLRELNNASGTWTTVRDKDVIAFALSADGRRIAAVSDSPLRGVAMERQGDGQWKMVDVAVDKCIEPQSVSAGSDYLIATWKARSCTFLLTGDRSMAAGRTEPAIEDSFVSPRGGAYVAQLTNRDLEVGRGSPAEPNRISTIKAAGAPPLPGGSGMNAIYAVDDAGTRLAVFSDGSVRTYVLGGQRLLLVAEPAQALEVSPDGAWVVQAAPLAGAEGAELRVTGLGGVLAGTELAQPRWRATLPAMPVKMFATRESVVASVYLSHEPSSLSTLIYDVVNGTPRTSPLRGDFTPLGAEHGLLLFTAASTAGGDRLVRTRDGAGVAPWEALDGHAAEVSIVHSPASTALLVTRHADPGSASWVADAYLVRGDRLEPVGRLVDLPALPRRMGISDDARSVTEVRETEATQPGTARVRRPQANLKWDLAPGRVTSARDPAQGLKVTPAAARRQAEKPPVRSPSGRFTVVSKTVAPGRSEVVLVGPSGGPPPFTLARNDSSGQWFSADERWLAYADDDHLRLFDLSTWRLMLDLAGVNPSDVTFFAGNTLLQVMMSDGNKMLVPIDGDMMQRFAKWLVPRPLTPKERCDYSIDAASACRDTAATSSRNGRTVPPRRSP